MGRLAQEKPQAAKLSLVAAPPKRVAGAIFRLLPGEWSRPLDWSATMRWQDQLQEEGAVVGAIRNPR
jgi:hypothetical protein